MRLCVFFFLKKKEKQNNTLVLSFEAHQTFNEKRFVVEEICMSPSFGPRPGLSFSIQKLEKKRIDNISVSAM